MRKEGKDIFEKIKETLSLKNKKSLKQALGFYVCLLGFCLLAALVIFLIGSIFGVENTFARTAYEIFRIVLVVLLCIAILMNRDMDEIWPSTYYFKKHSIEHSIIVIAIPVLAFLWTLDRGEIGGLTLVALISCGPAKVSGQSKIDIITIEHRHQAI